MSSDAICSAAAAAAVEADASRHPSMPKEVICYPCALRMSMLFHYPPPRTLGQLQSSLNFAGDTQASSSEGRPILDDEYHSLFTIVHETSQSARRYFQGDLQRPRRTDDTAVDTARGSAARISCEPPQAGVSEGSTANGMLGGDAAPRYAVPWLCTACMGLYQFIDLIHAPLVAAAVRDSPFFDAEAITVNVNINRSFTFTWLAVATRYFDTKGTGIERPPPSSIVKEELSNFKDFYMSDLRARVLQYLLHTHEEIVASLASPALISRSSPLPGLTVYIDAVEAALRGKTACGASTKAAEGESALKRPRTEAEEVRLSMCSSATRNASCTSTNTTIPQTSEDASCSSLVALQAFRYSGTGESLVGEVYCRHHGTEGLITEGYMPAAYCGNRSTEVLPYSVVYDYAVPYLEQHGWLPATSAEGADKNPVDRRSIPRPAATVTCQLQHANIYLMGNYRKMMRNMSQSPWFLNSQRIGTFSLQEVIANPLLPFFFPDMPAAPLDALEPLGLPRSSDRAVSLVSNPAGDVSPAVERGAHATRWQAVAPSVASSLLVFGYNRYKFHSAGREDVDVRMLGEGRPFVIELCSPLREHFTVADLRRFEASINASYNGSVEVRGLRRTAADITVRLARHSESKVKRYRCVIWCSRAIEDVATDPFVLALHAMKDLSIYQTTPLRVLHRRSLHARPRLIHAMKLSPINAHWFLLDLETQAGTYVKEFVHGDMGRTTPHLGMLLHARTDIIQLDVVGMAMQDLDA